MKKKLEKEPEPITDCGFMGMGENDPEVIDTREKIDNPDYSLEGCDKDDGSY